MNSGTISCLLHWGVLAFPSGCDLISLKQWLLLFFRISERLECARGLTSASVKQATQGGDVEKSAFASSSNSLIKQDTSPVSLGGR